jgi:hypothetical protein
MRPDPYANEVHTSYPTCFERKERKMFTDNGPDYRCPLCGADTTGEIGHECSDELIDGQRETENGEGE